MSKHVAVLMGGWSAEREVSLVSGAAVVKALKDTDYKITAIDVQRDAANLLMSLSPRPDAVFNALHGPYGEDGCIQGLLNILGVPYTHSGVLSSAMAMDKPLAKQLFALNGLPVAEHCLATKEEILGGDVMPRPYVIKPLNEGSSVGIHIIHEGSNGPDLVGDKWTFGEQVMVESFIPGRELTVAVMGDKALAVTEIATDHEFYDYDAKYAVGGSRHEIPAKISQDIADLAKNRAITAHNALGCRGVTRVDFRFDESKGADGLIILEINTQPGLTPTSLVPEQAAYAGIPFKELISWMVEDASCDG
ncbi:MAG: D-alanine--D-alanine ligase [Alphaproteobacteria bacterium]|nr:D-alanine--D-alanine ligase [Rhodospirillales bacterium]MCW9044822.1 D-alanine--D-alanine ligase [Alphaproteobacteria bacterium]